MTSYPNIVPYDEWPEATIQNIPDETIEDILSRFARYGECSSCGTQQWHPVHHDETLEWDCSDCGETLYIIG